MSSTGRRTSSWGERAGFAAARWTVVLAAAAQMSGTARQRALEELAQAYWFPLYAYIRRQGRPAAEAEDLTQGFLARLLEKKSLASADPERGTITTPFDMTVLNELDRFHLVMDAIDRLPQTGETGLYLKQQLKERLIEHKQYIAKHGEDMPEVRNWKWGNPQ